MNSAIEHWTRGLAILAIGLLALGVAEGQSQSVAAEPTRQTRSLDGPWQLNQSGQSRWARVPGTFEQQIGIEFDGTARYSRRVVPFDIRAGHRLLLKFSAAATIADVFFNGVPVGRHVGGWTPFWVDVTDLARQSRGDEWTISIDVDEAVGHQSQGFLPIVAPHFGGLWQSVALEIVPEAWIDESRLHIAPQIQNGEIFLEIPLIGLDRRSSGALTISRAGDDGLVQLREIELDSIDANSIVSPDGNYGIASPATRWVRLTIPVREAFPEGLTLWSDIAPNLTNWKFQLVCGNRLDSIERAVGFRQMQVDGDRFLLNGRPLLLRGVLNWGYAPPGTSPNIDEAAMRREIEFARSRGFNLMKFCLWIPPKRYLELCDELGMLAWIEYPTWHAPLTQPNLPALSAEYDEFYFFDRSHVSVVLRSLTCETGPSADLQVIQTLYDRCKQFVPGAVVEDDSSWIEWNRVHDFYDDHPYGNNRTWPATLNRLREYIDHRNIQPLVLGEAIAADTWSRPRDFYPPSDGHGPFWWPKHVASDRDWLKRLSIDDDALLAAESRRYAMLMRKYQIETYRRMVPNGGYVVSVIRDFPLAGMGLIDYRGLPKWSCCAPSDDSWVFHGPTMILLQTPNDQRGLSCDEKTPLRFSVSHFGAESLEQGVLRIEASTPNEKMEPYLAQFPLNANSTGVLPGTLTADQEVALATTTVARPTPLSIVAKLYDGEKKVVENHWRLWLFPPLTPPGNWEVVAHRTELFANESPLAQWPVWDHQSEAKKRIVVARQWDPELLKFVEAGGRVLMLPNGQRGSFAVADHWFLRGGPAVFRDAETAASQVATDAVPAVDSGWRDLLAVGGPAIDLQHFDWSGPVVERMDPWLARVKPWIVLWDNHDLSETRTHGLLFEMPVGLGRVLVCAMNVNADSADTASGHWLRNVCLRRLAADVSMDRELGRENAVRLQSELGRFEFDLGNLSWRFHPDPENAGDASGWGGVSIDDSDWPTLSIRQHWEGQGYESLDGWAWYRVSLELPPELANAPRLYLTFTGVDDYYECFVNGKRIGSGGDLATKTTAFDQRKCFEITDAVDAERPLLLAAKVYDWQGAGGIFRPVILSSEPLSEDPPMLK